MPEIENRSEGQGGVLGAGPVTRLRQRWALLTLALFALLIVA